MENEVSDVVDPHGKHGTRKKGGARYRVRTCDPHRVKVVLYR